MYLASVFKTLLNYSVLRVKLQLDGQLIEQTSAVIAIANGRCIGGGFWVAPQALHDDGLFDVMIADGLNRRGILALLTKVMQGTHLGEPCVKFVRVARVTLESPDPLVIESDGEIPFIGAQRVQIENLPKRIRVFA
jgi:diacylglycerol kinase (ATP)